MMRKVVIFPFMVALYPIMALLADNLGQIGLGDGVRPLLISLLAGSVLFAIAGWLLKSWRKAGLAAALVLILFFSYGHLYRWLEGTNIVGINLGRHRILVPIYAILMIAGWLAIKRIKRVEDHWVILLNTISMTMVILTVIQIGAYQWNRWQAAQDDSAVIASPTERFEFNDLDELPDIYYIILDEYGRRDVLQEIYGLDNQPFEANLVEVGFQVLEESRTNYAQTELALSANLNLYYLQDLGGDLNVEEDDRAILWDWIQHNQLIQALEEVGYRTVAFASGFHWSEFKSADVFLQPPLSLIDQLRSAGVTNAFEGMLMQTSAGLILIDALQKYQADLEYPYRMHRLRILYTLDQLSEDVPGLPGPKFVFAHIIAPHGPLVLGPNGEAEVSQDLDQAYRDEVAYLNRRLMEVITGILLASERPPIIILQADTGPAVHLDWDAPDDETLWARMTIFNAIYLPEDIRMDIPHDMSSVNSFRLIFNLLFDAGYPFLEDRSYFSNWDRPYDFVDVTSEVLSYP